MSANINKETGIRYGVIDARNVMYLYEEMIQSGDDLTYAAWKKEMIDSIRSAIESACNIGKYRMERLDDTLQEIAENAFDSLQDADAFFYESDESEYSYTDSSDNEFLLSYLGGAPLIWCIKTSRIGYTKAYCSPCVPNAGDLDSGFTDDPNGDTYGVPVEYLESEETEETPEENPSQES